MNGNPIENIKQKINEGNYYDAITLLTPILASPDRSEEVLYLTGYCLHKIKNHTTALDMFNSALEEKSDYKEALFGKAMTLNDLNRYQEALDILESLITEDDSKKEYYYQKGISYYRQKQNEEALEAFDNALSIDTDYIDALTIKAELLYSMKDHKTAEALYRHLLEIDTTDETAYAGLIKSSEKNETLEQVLELINKILSGDKENLTAYHYKLTILNRLERTEEAYREAQLMLEKSPKNLYARSLLWANLSDKNDPKSWREEGEELQQLKENSSAYLCYELASKLDDGNNEKIKIKMARILLNMSRYDEAIKIYDEILGNGNTGIDPLLGRAEALIGKSRFDEAGDVIGRILESEPENIDALTGMAKLYMEEGDYGEAIELCERIITHEPENTVALNMLGDAFFYLEDEDKAMNYYRKALAINPNDTHTLNNLGDIFLEDGDYREALNQYKKALEIDPDDIPSLRNKANIEKELKMYGEANEDLDKALRLDPMNIDLLMDKADIYKEAYHTNKRYRSKMTDAYSMEAIRLYDAILKMDPYNTKVLRSKIELYKDSQEAEPLLKTYDLLFDFDDPTNDDLKDKKEIEKKIEKVENKEMNKAEKAFEKNKLEKAFENCQKVRFPYSKAYMGMAHVFHATGKEHEAYISFMKAGELFYRSGELEKAIDCYTKASDIIMDSVYKKATRNPAPLMVAESAYEKGDYELATQYYEKTLDEYSKNHYLSIEVMGSIHDRTGRAYEKLEEYKKAISHYKKALKLNPDNETIYFNRLHAYYKMKTGKTPYKEELSETSRFFTSDAFKDTSIGLFPTNMITYAIRRFMKHMVIEYPY